MTSDEAMNILKTIGALYPMFERGDVETVKFKMKIWHGKIMEWDYIKTKKKLEAYALSSEYPPSLAEIKPRVQANYSMKEQLKEIYGEKYD